MGWEDLFSEMPMQQQGHVRAEGVDGRAVF